MAFIDDLQYYAGKHGSPNHVLPALIVAQGILESANGTSELAINARNLFGVKKGTGWDGPVYAKESSEWSEAKGWYTAVSEFRQYETIEQSVIDLVEKYTTMPRYADVLNQTTLEAAAFATWKAGYATDPTYPQKLINIGIQYNLQNEEQEEPIMAKKVMTIAAGHAGFGVTPGKRGPDGKVEWEWNNAVVLAAIAHAKRYYPNIDVRRVDDPTGRVDVSLTERCRRANAAKAVLHVDVHHNAMSTAWFSGPGGVETYVMKPASNNPGSMAAAREIHKRIVAAMGLKDRGVKDANFAMLRDTNMPAVLSEGGFMDSRTDRKAMDDPKRLVAQGEGIMDGAAVYLKEKKRTTPVSVPAPKPVPAPAKPEAPKNWFRVRESWGNVASQLGAFGDFEGAKEVADLNPGYEVYDDDGKQVYPHPKPAPVKNQKWYRVRDEWIDEVGQLAAFHQDAEGLKGAKEIADKHAAKGYKVFDNDGKVVYDPKPAPIEWPSYPMGVLDRKGEVKIKVETAYRRLPDNNSPIISTLKVGHECHFYEIRGDFYRLGAGWVYKGTLDVTKHYWTGQYDKTEGLIVLHSENDFPAIIELQKRTAYPVILKSAAAQHKANNIIVVGGGLDGFDKKGNAVLLSGKTKEDTDAAVAKYLKS